MEGAMNRMMSGVADFALGLAPEDVPDTARRDAALMLLDTLGVAAAASPMEAGRIARDTASLLYGSSDPTHRARMLFDGREASLAGAAYAAATQTDNLDAHDGYNPVKGHIGVAIIPALLALAEQAKPMSGSEALMLVTLGYEIAGRAGLALHATVSDYHTSGAWNALGVAAMASRLRGLSASQLREAVGISSTILAERGFTGAPAITVEAEEAASFWSDLGSRWIMQAQYVKPYPICRWAHAPIDGVRDLMLAHGLGPDDIRHIRINTFHESACLFQGVPDSTSIAQYSLSFAVATQAVHGRIGVEQVSGDGLADTAVHAMIKRISVAESDAHNATFPHTRDADVQITLNDGRVLNSGLVHARGGSERPMDESEIIAKFKDYASPVIGADRARAIVAAVTGMADGTCGLDGLRAHLYAPT